MLPPDKKTMATPGLMGKHLIFKVLGKSYGVNGLAVRETAQHRRIILCAA